MHAARALVGCASSQDSQHHRAAEACAFLWGCRFALWMGGLEISALNL